MKINSLRLMAAAALGSLLVFTNVSSAQNTNATDRAARRGQMIEQRVKRISTELNLKEDQKAKIIALFQKEAKERREILNLPREERRDKMRELMQEQNKQFKLILSSEQFEKWQTLRQQMRNNRPRNRGQQPEEAAPAPAPAPAPNSAK